MCCLLERGRSKFISFKQFIRLKRPGRGVEAERQAAEVVQRNLGKSDLKKLRKSTEAIQTLTQLKKERQVNTKGQVRAEGARKLRTIIDTESIVLQGVRQGRRSTIEKENSLLF